jgi:DHA1 family tetracycline resistance protein-like MFS transporter
MIPSMSSPPRHTLPLLCLIVFLLLLSTGTQFPTLNPYGIELGANEARLGWLWFWFAIPRAIFGPFWASFSDVYGRRPVFILGGLGMIAGSVVWALAGSFEMLIASRIVDSVLSAQAAVAFAVVADITPPEKRAASMGLLGVSASLAFIFGPGLGAFLASATNLASVGWLNAGLQGSALLLAVFFLPETVRSTGPRTFSLPILQATTWTRLSTLPRVPQLLLVTLIFTVGYTQFNTAFQLGMERRFGFDQRMVGVAWMILGFFSALSQGGLVRSLVPRFGEAGVAAMGICVTAGGLALMAFSPTTTFVWVATALLGLGVGMAIAALAGLISRSTPQADQGIVQGLSQTAQQLGRGLGPLLGSMTIAAFGARIPFVVAAIVVLVSLVGFWRYRRPR